MRVVLFSTILYFSFCIQTAFAVDELFSTGIESDNVRGLVKPVQKATISGEIDGKIKKIPFKASTRFKKGDVLVAFDCSFYQADYAAVEAAYKSKQYVYENNKQLLALNAISDIEVLVSEAELKVAKAERIMQGIRVRQCNIKAPYNGRVIDIVVNEHENLSAGREILSILDDRDLEIELIVPSNWLNWLSIGEPFSFNIDETGKTHQAKVFKIGAVVDPVSQTIKLTGKFEGPLDGVLSGMSGTAIFKKVSNLKSH